MECTPPGRTTHQRHPGRGIHFLRLLPGPLHLLPEFSLEPGWIGTSRWSRTPGRYDALLAKEEVSQPGSSYTHPFCTTNPTRPLCAKCIDRSAHCNSTKKGLHGADS